MNRRLILLAAALCAIPIAVFALDRFDIKEDPDGTQFGTSASQKCAFYGATPVAQRSGANQTALTDNTGGSVSNATLADGLTATALTDSSGGAAADGTIGAVTAPTALTDNGGGTADATIASLAATTALTVTDGAGTNDGTIGAITDNASTITAVQELAAKIATLITWQGTVQDNFKELTTAQAANRTATIALTDAVKELSTQLNLVIADDGTQNSNDAKIAELVNELRAALVAFGPIAGS